MKRLLILALGPCLTFLAHAEFKDGNKLLSDMNSGHGQQMNAIGYVTGVADTLMGVTYCPPTNMTAGQVYDMTKQYLETYPATRHMSADSIINRVLKSAWPCAERRGGSNL
jgi:hypothetical protein